MNSSYRFAFQSGFVSRQLNEIDFYSAISQFDFTCGIVFSQLFEVIFPALSKIFNNLQILLFFFTRIFGNCQKHLFSRSLEAFPRFSAQFPTQIFTCECILGAGKKAKRHKWALKVHFRCVKHTIVAERPPFCVVKHELCLNVLTVCPATQCDGATG